ncbi:hypothetical protein CF327_g7053 [Tilletia walkeri]|uniref:Uncharacterized protein n=1 Tax=Tilletia walkeri TaxID=117179 RepID=A0A8X7N4Y7_9BASI|nr:hypothetical protein CF327_g7053 [Tilletia walkeri]KAE8265363.1 hypothetical protein A4X09_0g6673 [Tilletia walkeri]
MCKRAPSHTFAYIHSRTVVSHQNETSKTSKHANTSTRGAAAAEKAANVAAASGRSSTSGPSPEAGSRSRAAQKEVSKGDEPKGEEPESNTQLSDILEDFPVEKRLDKIPPASRLPISAPEFGPFIAPRSHPENSTNPFATGELNKSFRDQAVAGVVKAVRNPHIKQIADDIATKGA